jgi:DNA-binding transcriptional ArsR family regulator
MNGAITIREMLASTTLQQVLSLLVEHPDRGYFVTEISRLTGLSAGGASQALARLHQLGLVSREKRGRLVLYAADAHHPIVRQYRILLTLVDLTSLLDQLKPLALEITLFGSCAEGANTADSDIDLYVVADDPSTVHEVIWASPLSRKLRPVAVTPLESAETRQQDPVFYEQVMRGILLWRRPTPDES